MSEILIGILIGAGIGFGLAEIRNARWMSRHLRTVRYALNTRECPSCGHEIPEWHER